MSCFFRHLVLLTPICRLASLLTASNQSFFANYTSSMETVETPLDPPLGPGVRKYVIWYHFGPAWCVHGDAIIITSLIAQNWRAKLLLFNPYTTLSIALSRDSRQQGGKEHTPLYGLHKRANSPRVSSLFISTLTKIEH